MAERLDDFTPMAEWEGDVEAMIRAAGSYVRASDDLRPRVLENAKIVRCEWRVQRGTRKAALFFIFAGLLTIAIREVLPARSFQPIGWLAASSNPLLLPAPVTNGSDATWQLVDSFSELRRRQAMVLGNSP